jgi:hypothetical protein
VTGRTEKGAETELELLLLPSTKMDARAFAHLARLPHWHRLIGSAMIPSWSWNCRHCAMSAALPKPMSQSRIFEATPAKACGMAF